MEIGLTSILSHICLLCSQFLGKGGKCAFVSVEGGGGRNDVVHYKELLQSRPLSFNSLFDNKNINKIFDR